VTFPTLYPIFRWAKEASLPIPIGSWRSVGYSYNTFVTESFIDELANSAGKDPVAFRLHLLEKEPERKAVLELATIKANWGGPLPENHYQGVAFHCGFGSIAAQVAEIPIKENNTIRVHRVVCVINCGTVINPDTVKAQIEGAIVFGLTATLKSQITLQSSKVQQSNYVSDQPTTPL
jgi:isoquinoline 1-oxidoreductase beta subunit